MTEESYDELLVHDWTLMPEGSLFMKYKFDEDGCMMMVSDLVAVYGEKLDEKAIQERFQILNPYAEMLPKVILRYVEKSVRCIWKAEHISVPTEFKASLLTNKATIRLEFVTGVMHFIFIFEPQKLSDHQFKAHILRPMLLRALILDEEKTTLLRKVEAFEGRQCSSSSSRKEDARKRKEDINVKRKAIYSELQKNYPPGAGVFDAFIYLQKDRIDLLKRPPRVDQEEGNHSSPIKRTMKGIHSSSTSSFSHMKIKNSKNKSINISYEEGDSDMNLESLNRLQQSEEPDLSMKIEKNEENETKNFDMNLESQSRMQQSEEPCLSIKIEKNKDNESNLNEYNLSSNNLSAKNGEHSNLCLSGMKREMAEEDGREENVSKLAPHLKPSSSKMKKLLKF